jgi:hypothetical protein
MTIPHPAPPLPLPQEPPPFRVTPAEGDWLDELLGQYEAAKARADEAADYAKSLDAKIKGYLTGSAPQGTKAIEVTGNAWRKARTLNWITPRKFNGKRFAAEHPDTYEAYREYGKGYWSW